MPNCLFITLLLACVLRENLSNQASGVQITCDNNCACFGRYLYSTNCSWIIKLYSTSKKISAKTSTCSLFDEYSTAVSDLHVPYFVLEFFQIWFALFSSQSLSTLSVIEEFLSKCDVPFYPGRVADLLKPVRWAKNKSYFSKKKQLK